jgi:1-acyl-sn-glycerol-3-phosphate acyltransferase
VSRLTVCKCGTVIRRFIGRTVLRITRWRVGGTAPDEPKYVLIAAPHTSNWDLLYLLALSFALGVKVSWLGKDSLFRGPMGFVLRRFGGVPVRRGQRSGMVESLAAEFERTESLVVVIPPEATRGTTDHWKSGFYRVAVAAQVPIVCGYLDYGHRVGGFGQVVWPTGDLDADMAVFRSFYADIRGKYTANVGEIKFRNEDEERLTTVR